MDILKKLLIGILSVLFTVQVYAKDAAAPNSQMAAIADLMREVYPLISRDSGELNEKQVEELRRNVDLVYKHIDDADILLNEKTDTSNLSMKTLKSHLASTKKALNNGSIRYAQGLMRSATNLCSGCHILDSKERVYESAKTKAQFFNQADLADFYFMTRNYRSALMNYQDQIQFGEKIRWGSVGYDAIKNSLVIYLQIDRDTSKAYAFLKDILKKSQVDDGVKSEINHWLKGINQIDEKEIPRTASTLKTIKQQMNEVIFFNNEEQLYHLLQEDQYPVALWLRGLINEYIKNNESAKKEMPMLLFWLASIDRSIEFDLYYSLADLYLKQCIIEYTKDPFAEKCYALYEDYAYFASTGSAGRQLPEELKEELKQLRRILNDAR